MGQAASRRRKAWPQCEPPRGFTASAEGSQFAGADFAARRCGFQPPTYASASAKNRTTAPFRERSSVHVSMNVILALYTTHALWPGGAVARGRESVTLLSHHTSSWPFHSAV